jgi:hypothetical protein
MAETDGFEPSVEFDPYGGLANRWFKPLTHVSIITNCSTLLKVYLGVADNSYSVDPYTYLLTKNHTFRSRQHQKIHYVFETLDENLYRVVLFRAF